MLSQFQQLIKSSYLSYPINVSSKEGHHHTTNPNTNNK